MSKEFKKLAGQRRIESPIAKYNAVGQLTCIICNQVVKSELVWNAHINSKSHLDAKNQLKMKLVAEQAKPISSSTSSSNNKTSEVESKATENNLKVNSFNNTSMNHSNNECNLKSNESVNNKASKRSNTETTNSNLDTLNKKPKIDHMVDKTSSLSLNNNKQIENETKPEPETEATTSNASASSVPLGLPEGFFDDPDLDAKARGQSREANLDAEYEEFKKIIQSEEVKSELLIETDDKARDFERDIEEVDELIGRWNKIENLHVQREAIKKKMSESKASKKLESESDDEDDEEISVENILNMELRSKKIL